MAGECEEIVRETVDRHRDEDRQGDEGHLRSGGAPPSIQESESQRHTEGGEAERAEGRREFEEHVVREHARVEGRLSRHLPISPTVVVRTHAEEGIRRPHARGEPPEFRPRWTPREGVGDRLQGLGLGSEGVARRASTHDQPGHARLHALSREPGGVLVNEIPHQQVLAFVRGRAKDRIDRDRLAGQDIAGQVGAWTVDQGTLRTLVEVIRKMDFLALAPGPPPHVPHRDRNHDARARVHRELRWRIVGRGVEVVGVLSPESDLGNLGASHEESEHAEVEDDGNETAAARLEPGRDKKAGKTRDPRAARIGEGEPRGKEEHEQGPTPRPRPQEDNAREERIEDHGRAEVRILRSRGGASHPRDVEGNLPKRAEKHVERSDTAAFEQGED